MKNIKSKFNNFYYRSKNAIKMGVWSYKNHEIFRQGNFKMLSDLLGLILKVATENRHMMTHVAFVHPDEGEKQIVSIWAGAGIGAEPTKRIQELITENAMLKMKLSEYIKPETQQNP